jgi:hypothetical protein
LPARAKRRAIALWEEFGRMAAGDSDFDAIRDGRAFAEIVQPQPA